MSEKIIVICREFDKRGNRKPLTYIVNRNATDRNLALLSIRSRFNPELEYYATTLGKDDVIDDDKILFLAKAKQLREPYFKRI